MKYLYILFIVALLTISCTYEESNSQCTDLNPLITVVNIGNLNRYEIGKVVEKIQKKKPSVIGINVVFSKKMKGDSSLAKTLSANNIVMAIALLENKVEKSYFDIDQGFSNYFVYNDGLVDKFISKDIIDNDTLESFAYQILKKYNPTKAIKYNNYDMSKINFYGDHICFGATESTQIDDIKDEFIKDKIVLIGYLGDKIRFTDYVKDDMDLHSTSFNGNEKMYGTLINANILDTMLKGKGN